MRDQIGDSKLDMGIVLWLIALSFWSGVSYFQIQNNTLQLEQSRTTRIRLWDKLDRMQHDLDIIAGYIKAKEGSPP